MQQHSLLAIWIQLTPGSRKNLLEKLQGSGGSKFPSSDDQNMAYPGQLKQLLMKCLIGQYWLLPRKLILQPCMKIYWRARSALNDPEKLIIVSTSAEHLGELEENKLPCDARMQTVVNGSRISLNARVGRKVLIEAGRWPLNISLLKDRYSRLIAKQPDIHRYERCPMSDTEIIQYIKAAIKQTPDLTATRTLREFRDKGNACEQKRFGKLFREVKGESSGA